MKLFQGATHFVKCFGNIHYLTPLHFSDVLPKEPRLHQYITLIRRQMQEYATEKH